MAENKDLSLLVALGEQSRLKSDLNRCVAALLQERTGHLKPRICLNGRGGIEVIRAIANDPGRANTQFRISAHPIYGGNSNLWLNVQFWICLDKISSDRMVTLTPRQTSCIVTRLPSESQQAVLAAVKAWHMDCFRQQMQTALETITKQFESGNPLCQDEFFGRIFDIHKRDGEGLSDTPYTEWQIAGADVFGALFFGHSVSSRGQDPYDRLDQAIAMARQDTLATARAFQTLADCAWYGEHAADMEEPDGEGSLRDTLGQ